MDFGIKDSNNTKSKFKAFPKIITDKIAVKDPTIPPTKTGKKYFFKRFNCLYKGTANTTVAGPNKNKI